MLTKLTKRLAVFSLVMGFAMAPAAAQQPPDPATHPNVKDVTIRGSPATKSLDVNKNNTAKVKEIWKKQGSTWTLVWDLDGGGNYLITNNSNKKTHITNNPASTAFTAGDEFRIVAEATDADGNSTVINSIDQNTQP